MLTPWPPAAKVAQDANLPLLATHYRNHGLAKRPMNLIRFCIWLFVMFYLVDALRRWLNAPRGQQQQRSAPRSPPPPPPFRRDEPSPYQVLGVAPGASPQEIRAAYQKLIQGYHPDQVAHLGDELREVAERRTKEINAAYNALKRRPQGSQ